MSEKDKGMRTKLVGLAFVLFSIFVVGMFWLSTSPGESVTLALSYAAGLSMIVLPCTLPLVFVIVPLSMGKGYKKGLFMALLFGLGLTLTITAYGVFIALAGGVIGLDQTTTLMWLIGGSLALLFGLSELKLLRIPLPSYGGATPKFVEKQGDYLKAFFLGMFLGNAGVGCPNPAFYILLGYIATTGDIFTGAGLGFIHGLGRATPLIFIAILGVLGVNATQGILKKKELVTKLIGWGLVFMGALIIINGLPGGHGWYEETFVHQGWNNIVKVMGLEGIAEIEMHAHAEELTTIEELFGQNMLFIFSALILIPIIWYYLKKPK